MKPAAGMRPTVATKPPPAKAASQVRQAKRAKAMARRLADRPAQRWAWAAACALPLVGLPALLWHGLGRRTALPFLYGLTSQAIGAFLLATVASSLWAPPDAAPGPAGGERRRSDGALAAALLLAASGCFALGHQQGQAKAARDAASWLRLDD